MKYLLVFLLTLSSFIQAQNVLDLDENIGEYNLNKFASYYRDTLDFDTPSEIPSDSWKKLNKVPHFTHNNAIQWLSYNVKNNYNKDIDRVLYIPYHFIKAIDVFVSYNDEPPFLLRQQGTSRSFDDKDYVSISYPIKVNLRANSTTRIFIKYDNLFRPLRATVYLMDNRAIMKSISYSDKIIWLWHGPYAIAFIISLILFLYLRNNFFFYYMLFNMGMGLFIGSHIGDYFLFFDVDSLDYILVLDYLGAMIINLSFPIYLNSLTPIKNRNKLVWRVLFAFIYLMPVLLIILLIPQVRYSSFMMFVHYYYMILSSVSFIVILYMLINNVRHKDKNAKLVFTIYGLYILAGFADILLPNMGLVKDSTFVYNYLLLGSFFEIFSFMILMGKESFSIYKDRESLLEKQKWHQKEMMQKIFEGQEKERNKIGRDLHDLIGANMSIIKNKIDKTDVDLTYTVNNTIDSVRKMSHGLTIPTVKEDEFVNEIKQLGHLFSNNSMKVNVLFHDWPTELKEETTTHIFRIIQELLQNASKHSKATYVYLQFIGETINDISIIYEDNGVGFNYNKISFQGMGLVNIRNRVQLLNGNLQVDSKENGRGTTVIIEVKINK